LTDINVFSDSDFWLKTAWLLFMLADVPRLFFLKKSASSSDHVKKKYSKGRIISQITLQNICYMLALFILYLYSSEFLFLMLLIIYLILHLVRLFDQIKIKNDFAVKPLRMLILILTAIKLGQLAWLLGCGILFGKWILTIFLERLFMIVPKWYHVTLVILSALLVLLIFPYDLGIIERDILKDFLTTVSNIYITYIGLLAVFLSIIFPDKDKTDLRQHFIEGIVRIFACTSLLLIFCVFGLFIFGKEPLDLLGSVLFKRDGGYMSLSSRYFLFGVIISMTWLLFFYTLLTSYLMLITENKKANLSFRK
jgi:hypothetical protein